MWHCRNLKLDLTSHTHLMGILNVTPDSFSDGGFFLEPDRAVEHAIKMEQEGADIIDIGGESTRPGSLPVSEQEEMDRVLPVIENLINHIQIPISIDTYKAKVALAALEAGASIVNDISGCRFDPLMPNIIAQTKAGLIIMHIKGTPRNMQENPHYKNVLSEIIEYFQQCISTVSQKGVAKSCIVLDPGIGFGKRLKDNFDILQNLNRLTYLGYPILVGPSRKSFIGKILNLPPEKRLEGTAATVTASILHGADIIRVHDIKQMKHVATIADAIIGKIEVAE